MKRILKVLALCSIIHYIIVFIYLFNRRLVIARNDLRRPEVSGPSVNDKIEANEVRLVDENGDMVGVVSTNEALQMAYDAGLDLVEVSPNANPPVCKILDYGKYKYQEEKRKTEAKKKQKTLQVKELTFRPNIEEHDFQTKLRAAKKFLEAGHKVKLTMRYRGREMSRQEVGSQILYRMAEELGEEIVKIDQEPKLDGRAMVMLLSPNKG